MAYYEDMGGQGTPLPLVRSATHCHWWESAPHCFWWEGRPIAIGGRDTLVPSVQKDIGRILYGYCNDLTGYHKYVIRTT